MIVELASTEIHTRYGTFREILFYDGQKETIAILVGNSAEQEAVLCRIHSSCIYGHYFNSVECTCQEEMNRAQEMIAAAGQGLIILMDQEGKGNGHYALMQSITHKRKGIPQPQAYEAAGFEKENRNFAAAAKVIQHLGIRSVRLLTNNPRKRDTLTRYGIQVEGTVNLLQD